MPPVAKAAPIGHNKPPTAEELLAEKHKPLFDRAKAWLKKATKANMEPVTMADCLALDKLFAEGRDIFNDAESVRKVEKDEYLRAGQAVDEFFNKGLLNVIGATKAKPGPAFQIMQASADRKLAITRAQQAVAAAEEERLRKKADEAAAKAKALDEAGNVKVADKEFAKAEALDQAADQAAAHATASVSDLSKVKVDGVSSSVGVKKVCTGIHNRQALPMDLILPFVKEADLIAAVDAYLKANPSTVAVSGAAIKEQAVGRVR